MTEAFKNDDIEIWRQMEGNQYSPSVHVNHCGGIGIHAGGSVVVMSAEDWITAGQHFYMTFKGLPITEDSATVDAFCIH